MSSCLVCPEQIAIITHHVLTKRPTIFENWLGAAKLQAQDLEKIWEAEKGVAQEILGFKIDSSDDEKFALLSKVLANANIASLVEKYNDKTQLSDFLAEIEAVKYDVYPHGCNIQFPHYLNFCADLAYQCCSSDNWEISLARLFIIYERTGHDTAKAPFTQFPWSYDPKSFVVENS